MQCGVFSPWVNFAQFLRGDATGVTGQGEKCQHTEEKVRIKSL